MQIIEDILRSGNLTQASREVIRNQGAAGVDAMGVDALKPYLDRHREALAAQIRRGDYYPQPIRGREIPKSNKKKRLLGIPTVVTATNPVSQDQMQGDDASDPPMVASSDPDRRQID